MMTSMRLQSREAMFFLMSKERVLCSIKDSISFNLCVCEWEYDYGDYFEINLWESEKGLSRNVAALTFKLNTHMKM